VINDKSQGSIVKHLSGDGLLHYIYIFESAAERIFKIGKHLANNNNNDRLTVFDPGQPG